MREESRGRDRAREDFRRLFGSLKGQDAAWTELRLLKESEKRRLSSRANTSQKNNECAS